MWKIFIYKMVVINTLENIFALAIKLLITNTFAESTLFFPTSMLLGSYILPLQRIRINNITDKNKQIRAP
jgi:hypothetical protein